MTDKCTEVRDVLALEGKVPLGPNDATLREHLEGCVECASFLKSLSAVEAELGALPAQRMSRMTLSPRFSHAKS